MKTLELELLDKFDLQLFAETNPDEEGEEIIPDKEETPPEDEETKALYAEFEALSLKEKKAWLTTGKEGHAGLTRKFEELARREDGRKDFDPLIQMANKDPDLYNAIADEVNAYVADMDAWRAKRGGTGGKAEDKPALDDMPEDLKPIFELADKRYAKGTEASIEKIVAKILDKRLEPVENSIKARNAQDANAAIEEAREVMSSVHLQNTKSKLTAAQIEGIEKLTLTYQWFVIDANGEKKWVKPVDVYRRAYREYFLDIAAQNAVEKGRKEGLEEFTGLKKKSTAGGGGNIGDRDPYRNADGTIDRDRKIADRLRELDEK